MFKVRQDYNATNGDGVQNSCDNEFLSDYFLYCRRGFKMNEYVSAKKMETILDGKGDAQ